MRAPLRAGNRIDLLDSGAAFFPALLAAIESAAEEIFLETYIYAEDATAERITHALAAASRRGVKVRIVVDGFGARDMSPRLIALLADAGAAPLVYRRPLWWQPVRGLRRLHRKLAVVDHRVAFVGGINIIDDWNTPHEVPPRYDYAVRIAGPLVADVDAAVWHLWRLISYASFRRLGPRRPPAAPAPAGDMHARLLIRDNLAHRRDIEDAYLAALGAARESVLMAVAYFLPSRRVLQALRDASARGVAVRVLLQGPSDHRLMKFAAQFLYRRLIDTRVRVFEYHASFLHTKVAVVDLAWSTVGSSNLDPFSLLLSREANVEILDASFARELTASLERAMQAGAREVTGTDLERRHWVSRFAQWASFRFARGVVDWLHLG